MSSPSQSHLAYKNDWRYFSLNIPNSNINLKGHPLPNSIVSAKNTDGRKMTRRRKPRAVNSTLPWRMNSTPYMGLTKKTSTTGSSSVMSSELTHLKNAVQWVISCMDHWFLVRGSSLLLGCVEKACQSRRPCRKIQTEYSTLQIGERA